jgi:hypothetical protein
MKRWGLAGIAAAAFAGAALAQAPVEWSAVAKITDGSCGDGALVQVSEQPKLMRLKFSRPGGGTFTQVELVLGADGAGRIEFPGNTGLTRLEVPAGTGKRPLTTRQVSGPCQWQWTPK